MEVGDSSDEDEYEKEMKYAFDLVHQREQEKQAQLYEEYQKNLNDEEDLEEIQDMLGEDAKLMKKQ